MREVCEGTMSIPKLAAEERLLKDLASPRRRRAPDGAAMELPASPANDGAHQWALSVVVAAYARGDSAVQAFREQVLNSQLMDWADIPSWIEEQAAGRPPMLYVTARLEELPPEGADVMSVPTSGISVSTKMLRHTARGDDHVRLTPVRRGPLELLYDLTSHLATAYSWAVDGALAFVLADVVPYISNVTVTSGGENIRDQRSLEWSRRITLDVDPSVPPEELLEAVANFYPARVGGGGVVSRRRSSRLWAAHTNPSVTAGSRS